MVDSEFKFSTSIRQTIATKKYHRTLQLSAEAHKELDSVIAKLEADLAIQLALEADPNYKPKPVDVPKWVTRGT